MAVREEDTQVLVVGAGPAGLTAAITLARAGVEVTVIERRGELSSLPRATTVSIRSMEIFRGWGLEEEIRAIAPEVEWQGWLSETLASAEGGGLADGHPDPGAERRDQPHHPGLRRAGRARAGPARPPALAARLAGAAGRGADRARDRRRRGGGDGSPVRRPPAPCAGLAPDRRRWRPQRHPPPARDRHGGRDRGGRAQRAVSRAALGRRGRAPLRHLLGHPPRRSRDDAARRR